MYIITKREISFDVLEKQTRIFELENSDKKLYEIRADRMPIGVFIKEMKSFGSQIIQLEKGDRFFVFSDGYHDLYDRVNDRKFTTKRFKKLLLETSMLKMTDQEQQLSDTYTQWCGDYKQIDDIVVIGVEI